MGQNQIKNPRTMFSEILPYGGRPKEKNGMTPDVPFMTVPSVDKALFTDVSFHHSKRKNKTLIMFYSKKRFKLTSDSSRTLHFTDKTKSSLRPSCQTAAFIFDVVSSILSFFLDATTTLQPRYTNSSVIAFPMPVPPPVTIATLPEKRSGLKTELTLELSAMFQNSNIVKSRGAIPAYTGDRGLKQMA